MMAKKRCNVCWNHEEFCACGGGAEVIPFTRTPEEIREAEEFPEVWEWRSMNQQATTISLEELKRLFDEERDRYQ